MALRASKPKHLCADGKKQIVVRGLGTPDIDKAQVLKWKALTRLHAEWELEKPRKLSGGAWVALCVLSTRATARGVFIVTDLLCLVGGLSFRGVIGRRFRRVICSCFLIFGFGIGVHF